MVTIGWLLAASALAASTRTQPLRVVQTVEARFPDALAQRGIYEGAAKVVLLVDSEGRLADWLLTSYSHPLIAREATEALRQWRFEPARRGGEPVDVRTEMRFAFSATGMILSLSPVDFAEKFERTGPDQAVERLCRPSELDQPITPERTVAPLWPSDWKTPLSEGRVTLDFYIDDEGRPRMPAVVQTDDDVLNFPAVEALSHWRFVPPTRRGEPVMVRATQVFRFQRKG